MATYHIQELDDLITTSFMEMAETARDLTLRIGEVRTALSALPADASPEQMTAVLADPDEVTGRP